jgi:hypothetical protein
MITKADWRAAHEQLTADERARVGDPPTSEEMLAYLRGELTAEEEARVRERLVCHPELLRTLAEPFPTEPAKPGEPDFLSDDAFSEHWKSLRARMRGAASPASPSRVVQFPHVFGALAATVALVLGALLWNATSRLAEPRLMSGAQVIHSDARRGPRARTTTLTAAEGDSYLLSIPLRQVQDFDRYRLQIVDAVSGRVLWKSAPLRADQPAALLVVPRRFLQPGDYNIVVYGIGAGEERLTIHPVRVPAR